ncbi:MAG: tryptophan 2,3-dioxygenase family protein [Nitritalea sp.]
MTRETLPEAVYTKIVLLEEKFKASGQDLSSYLEGLLHADYMSYWDYINLDTLLSIQQPRTSFKDEKIFIVYHQITELYFNLILWEMDQISAEPKPREAFLLEKLGRIHLYFDQLISSFAVMWQGMEKEQFLKFRMSLLPSSGFQSAQYRFIELMATDVKHLLAQQHRGTATEKGDLETLFEALYWQQGAIELASGQKTLTLNSFIQKYGRKLKRTIKDYKKSNIWRKYQQVENPSEALREAMRQFDLKANVHWPLAHYKSAVHYLARKPEAIAATGGTNWQQYLPPRFQKVIFYPSLWSEQEQEEWGKGWVLKELLGEQEG